MRCPSDLNQQRRRTIVISNYAVIRESANQIAEAANRTVESLRDRRVEQEHQFTDRMLGRIEESMNGFEVKGLRWTAKTLTDKGPNSQEKKYGADFVGVLTIGLPDYSVRKGFLAQAKRAEPGVALSKTECARMKEQCELMLNLSPDSFVFLYSTTAITVVPAISVVGAKACDPYELYSRTVSRFFEEHFESFIGDRNIQSPDPQTLESLVTKYEARRLLDLRLSRSDLLSSGRTI